MTLLLTLLTLSTLSLMIDCMQTLNIKQHPGLYEINPILGKHPRDCSILLYFSICIAAFLSLAFFLPSTPVTLAILFAVLCLEIPVIINNYKLGL